MNIREQYSSLGILLCTCAITKFALEPCGHELHPHHDVDPFGLFNFLLPPVTRGDISCHESFIVCHSTSSLQSPTWHGDSYILQEEIYQHLLDFDLI